MNANNDAGQEVLEFWFGASAADAATFREKTNMWFMGGEALDRKIRERFASLVEQALAGELVGWEEEVRSRLALILLLDQFMRNLYRNDPRTYAGDAKAQWLALDAVVRGWDRDLDLAERQFLYMPFQHAENLALQMYGLQLMQRLAEEAPAELRDLYDLGPQQSRFYVSIIQRFGRFPHRNALLGRESTPAELAFMPEWNQQHTPQEKQEKS